VSLEGPARNEVTSAGNILPVDGNPTQAAHLDIDTPTHRGDIVAAAASLGIALAIYFLIIPDQVYVPAAFIGKANSPAFLPKAISMLLAILSAIYLIKSVIAYLREPQQGRALAIDWGIAGIMAVICIAYVAGILLFGMTIASGLCVAGTIYFFGERRYGLIVGIAVILPALLWYFFVKIANILLPEPGLQIIGDLGTVDALIAMAANFSHIAGLS
jgi:putative tricarboxylic transport membrane protein